jgi:hypothetical protein
MTSDPPSRISDQTNTLERKSFIFPLHPTKIQRRRATTAHTHPNRALLHAQVKIKMAEVGPPGASQPGIVAPPVCYFMDKLSPETRIRIYEHVFGPEKYVQRLRCEDEREYYHKGFMPATSIDDGRSQQYWPQRGNVEDFKYLHTGILAVNKLVHDEALETFYNVKVIRTTFDGFTSLMYLDGHYDLVRNVEIKHCDLIDSGYYVHEAMQDAQFLPQLKSFTILADFLSPHGRQQPISVRQFAHQHSLGDVTCAGIGTYSLSGRYSKIQIAHSDICAMWPSVACTPAGYDALEEINTIIEEWNVAKDDSIRVPWASHTSLRLWVAMLQLSLSSTDAEFPSSDPAHSPDEDSLLSHFWSSLCVRPSYTLRNRLIELEKPLSQLASGDDPNLLELFTEWLALAIRHFWDYTDTLEHGPRQPQWVELGYVSRGAQAAENQRIHENRLVSHPFCTTHRRRPEEIRQHMLRSAEIKGLVGADLIMNSSKALLQQVYYLCIAVGWLDYDVYDSDDDAVDWDRMTAFHNWSLGLLLKYLAVGAVPQDSALYGAGISSLSATFSFAMRTSYSRKRYVREVMDAGGGMSSTREHQAVTPNSAIMPMKVTMVQKGDEAGDDITGNGKAHDKDVFDGLVHEPLARELGPLLLEAQAIHESIT